MLVDVHSSSDAQAMQEIEAVGGTTVHKDPTDDDATSHWHRGSGAGGDENILTRDPSNAALQVRSVLLTFCVHPGGNSKPEHISGSDLGVCVNVLRSCLGP